MTEISQNDPNAGAEQGSGNYSSANQEILLEFLNKREPYFELVSAQDMARRMDARLHVEIDTKSVFPEGSEMLKIQTHFKEEGWLPETLQEARMVSIDSEDARINRAAATNQGSGER